MKGCGNARFRLLCLFSLLFGVAGIAGRTVHAATWNRVLEPWRIERDSRSFEILNTGALWDLLAIKPGMTVLDLGTGTGQFAYAFAERLQGQGKVYATDINDHCVRYVKEQAVKRELKNIVPVLVRREGLDEFYRSSTFDVIAMFHVSMVYEEKVDFLRYLQGSLADDGRLILLLYKGFPDFSLEDFNEDHDGLTKEILQEPTGTPFYRVFRESTRELLRASSGTGSGEGLKAIVEDLNSILAHANFGMDFFDGSAFEKELDFTREERDFANWLSIPNGKQNIVRLKIDGPWVRVRNARKINKLLIVQKYRKFLRIDRLYAPGLSPAGRAAFSRAGYALQREYADLIPFEDVVVFTRSH